MNNLPPLALPYSVECRMGRLVEARLYNPRTPDEIVAFAAEMRRAFSSARRKCVICADWRRANVLPPEVADELVNLLKRGNPHLERSAILLAREQASFNLQVERVVRESNNPARRAFRDPMRIQLWLAEVLTAAERQRMEEFLAEGS